MAPHITYMYGSRMQPQVMWGTAATMHKANTLPTAATEDDVRMIFRVALKRLPAAVQPLTSG